MSPASVSICEGVDGWMHLFVVLLVVTFFWFDELTLEVSGCMYMLDRMN